MSGTWTAPKTWTGVILPSAEMNQYIRDNEYYLKTHIALEAAGALTISGGIITVTQAYHKIDTEALAASDELNTISGGSEGMVIFLRAAHTDRTIILKDAIGNLILGEDIPLDDTNKHVSLIYNSAGKWQILNYLISDVAELPFCVTNAGYYTRFCKTFES